MVVAGFRRSGVSGFVLLFFVWGLLLFFRTVGFEELRQAACCGFWKLEQGLGFEEALNPTKRESLKP